MTTELIVAPAPPVESQPASTPTPQPTTPQSELDARFHAPYRMKLAGKPVQEIADSFGVCRETIWRWTKAVESEAQSQLANEPIFNMISREVARLTDLEEQARQGAETTKSDRAKAIYLSEARRAAVSRQGLLLSVGIIPKMPDQIFRVTATFKPEDGTAQPTDRLPRNEAIAKLIESMETARRIS